MSRGKVLWRLHCFSFLDYCRRGGPSLSELKAVSPSGDALWPEKFDSEALARLFGGIEINMCT